MYNIKEYLKEHNIKVTKSRIGVLKILLENQNAVNAESILEKCRRDNIKSDISTIYRTLELFEKKNIVKKFNLGLKKSSYAFIRKRHKHIVECRICHKQIEIDCPMQEIEEIVKKKTGFVIIDEDLDFKFSGICKQCRNKLMCRE